MDKRYGWFIEQSLDDQSLFDMVATVKIKSDKEDWKEHIVEIPEEKVGEVVRFLKEHLKEGWYAHIIKDNQVKVIFKDKEFEAQEGDSFKEIEEYGIAHGVSPDQMEVAGLFDLARESGF